MAYTLGILDACTRPAIGGVRAVWFFTIDNLVRWHYEATGTRQYGELIGYETGDSQPFDFEQIGFRGSDSSFGETPTDGPLRAYNQTLTLSVGGLGVAQRDALERLVWHSGAVAALVADLMGNYWVLGQTKGLRMNLSLSGGARGAQSEYRLTCNCIERSPMRVANAELLTFTPS